MGCTGTTSNLCYDPIKATCVDYDGALGANTTITSECVTQHDVNVDLYAITDSIINNADATVELVKNCLTYPLTSGVILTSTALEVHGEAICDHETRIGVLEGLDYSAIDITGWGLTIPACIQDACGDPITTLGQLLQAIMDEQCQLQV